MQRTERQPVMSNIYYKKSTLGACRLKPVGDTRMLSGRISLTFPSSALCANPRDIDIIAPERFHSQHVQTKKSRSNNTLTAPICTNSYRTFVKICTSKLSNHARTSNASSPRLLFPGLLKRMRMQITCDGDKMSVTS